MMELTAQPTFLHQLACPRVPLENPAFNVFKAGNALLPLGWIEQQEQNQLISSCCRHPETGFEIEAWYSKPSDAELGVPDIYIMYCSCGKRHIKWCTSPPETAGILVWSAPHITSAAVETLRPIWELVA